MCPQERVCRGSGITINNCHMVVNTHFTVEPLWGNQLCAWAGCPLSECVIKGAVDSLKRFTATGFMLALVRCCLCSVAQSYLTVCDPMDCSTPGFPVLHYLLEFAQTHVH